jgi:hypothetical protein
MRKKVILITPSLKRREFAALSAMSKIEDIE